MRGKYGYKGAGLVMVLAHEGIPLERIRSLIEKEGSGFIFDSDMRGFLDGADYAIQVLERLHKLETAAIEHAKEAKSEAEKAEEVAEVASDNQLPLPLGEPENPGTEYQTESESEDIENTGEGAIEEYPDDFKIEVGTEDVEFQGAVAYHAGHIAGLSTIKPYDEVYSSLSDDERKKRSLPQYDSFGTWATSSRMTARRNYGPYVYLVKVPAGKYYSVPQFSGQLYYDFFIKLPIVRKVRPDLAKRFETKEFEEWQNESDKKKRQQSDFDKEVIRPILFDRNYAKAWTDSWTSEGYAGIIWKDSRIDLRPDEAPHTVFLVFGSMEVIKQVGGV
jgi:hypothetical protein